MANTFELISSVTVGSGGAASIDFTSIPSTYTDLCLEVTARSDRNVYSFCYMRMRFNSSSSSYTYRILQGDGSSASSVDSTNPGLFTDGILVGGTTQSNGTSNTFSNSMAYIPNYAGSAFKSVSADGVTEGNTANTVAVFTAGLWSNTAAITSLSIVPWQGGTFNFLENSTAYLYGVKNA